MSAAGSQASVLGKRRLFVSQHRWWFRRNLSFDGLRGNVPIVGEIVHQIFAFGVAGVAFGKVLGLVFCSGAGVTI